ncbi:MAG: transferase [Pseudomonadota bacterium]
MTSWPRLTPASAETVLQRSEVCPKPYIHDDGEGLSLHFTAAELQSRMKKSSPWLLDVDYTLTMMGFLLFKPAPAHIVMIGLGGGSLAKFCYRQLTASRMTVIEINPHVMALRQAFCVPDNDSRFQVLEADGAAFLASQNALCDVLMIDGFDHTGQPDALCSQTFYDDCFHALTPDGLLMVNLHYEDEDFPLWVARIERSFAGNVVEIPAAEKSNCIVFASRGALLSPRRANLQASLSVLDAEARVLLRPEFTRVCWAMKDLGNGDESALNQHFAAS